MEWLSRASVGLVLVGAACSARPLHGVVETGPGNGGSAGGSGGRGGAGGTLGQAGTGGGTFTPTRKVDMLFLIDDSAETRLLQQTLFNNFPTLLTTLQNSARGLPDLRIAVVSSDLGAGDGSIAGCNATGGNKGIFQYTNRAPAGTDCTANALNPGETFISNMAGRANYTGDLASVFTCIAALGESGCGFEHQLAAITRALGADGAPPPAENQGFLRPEAFLFIMVVTNEDDCSAPPESGLYDTKSNVTLASPLGPPQNFRCNEFGHLCHGKPPPRFAPTGSASDTVTLDSCTSAEGAGLLTPVADVVAQIRALKRFPDQQIVVTSVAGPPTPYTVKWRKPQIADTGPWPEMAQSCTGSDLSWADPAVRIADWVQAFGPNGLLLSACDESFGGALFRLGELLDQAP